MSKPVSSAPVSASPFRALLRPVPKDPKETTTIQSSRFAIEIPEYERTKKWALPWKPQMRNSES